MNGVPLKGRIVDFDSFVVLLEVEGKQQMVFKHAISTIQPTKNVDLRPEADSGPVPE
jgi:host factor-I protein